MDDFDWQAAAQTDRLAHGLADGSIELAYDDGPTPELPPADAPVSVVRPIRLPYDVDEAARKLAAQRGVSVSVVLREWIIAGLEAGGAQPDPVTELRRSLDVAQRALNRIADAA
jgi:hypothetical protein